jgi:hypothetical protein
MRDAFIVSSFFEIFCLYSIQRKASTVGRCAEGMPASELEVDLKDA